MAIFTGDGSDDTFNGSSESDNIAGGAGSDVLSGSFGDDTIYSDVRSEYWVRPYYSNPYTPPTMDTGNEVDTIDAGAGYDRIYAGYGDNVNGGEGGDSLLISFQGATSGVSVDFRLLENNEPITIGGGTIIGIETIQWIDGSEFDDDIHAPNGYSNFAPIFGFGGNDNIFGGYYTGDIHGGVGNDTIIRSGPYSFGSFGEDGDDVIYAGYNGGISDGGRGNDHVYGSSGYDTILGGAGNDYIDGGSGSDTIEAGGGHDFVYGGGDEDQIDGGSGNDRIFGDQSDQGSGNAYTPATNRDYLWGGDGADIIHGDQGNDILWSGQRDQTINGFDDFGTEYDRLFGDTGSDILYLGIGDDGDGGFGNDILRLSLLGSANAVILSTSFFINNDTFSFFGGIIQNFETFDYLRLTRFDDTVTVTTMGAMLQVMGDSGNDVVTATGSSVTFRGGVGNDRFISGSAGDNFNGETGTDTVDYSSYTSGVTVTFGLAVGQNGTGAGGDSLVDVENIIGSNFADTLNGSNDANRIEGGDGDDTIDGKGGNDTLVGGAGIDRLTGGTGDDTYLVGADDASDTISEGVNAGTDTVLTKLVSFVLGDNLERLVFEGSGAFTGTGNILANSITGGARSDHLFGGDGNDTLVGLNGNDQIDGGLGADAMVGGIGLDTYYVDHLGDVATELAGEGIDRVNTTLLAYTLTSNIEDLSFVGTGDFSGAGNDLRNHIYGASGNDTLDGGGGADWLAGFLGNDTYIVDRSSDIVTEYNGEGTDTVRTTLSNYLLGDHLENLAYTGTGNFLGTGNALANLIDTSGASGNDRLDGKGGADTMIGGLGNDIYYTDKVNDVVVELLNEGIDIVLASANFTLGANLENLIYTGTADFRGTGNTLANRITGGVGNDRLDGGVGVDVLVGGLGNDTYYVDNTGDRANELAGGGTDLVFASATFTLGNETENLALLGLGVIDGTGNALANAVTGNNAANVLNGVFGNDILSGAGGADTLVGGLGSDTLRGGGDGDLFVFNTINEFGGSGAPDLITDFNRVQGDHISLSAIDASNKVAGDQAFAFIGAAAFGHVAGQLRYVIAGAVTTVQGDINGDGTADFSLELTGAIGLMAADFVL